MIFSMNSLNSSLWSSLEKMSSMVLQVLYFSFTVIFLVLSTREMSPYVFAIRVESILRLKSTYLLIFSCVLLLISSSLAER